MNTIQTLDGKFPIDRFGKGQAFLRPSSERIMDRDVVNFCCYEPLPVGATGVLLDDGSEPLRARVVERFGDFYNAEVLDTDGQPEEAREATDTKESP